jgi:tripartite-type tricarboxylate transporter receptor subunit TctC
MLVPFPPGGISDVLARALGARLTATMGRSVLIDNRPGAGTTIASAMTASSAPDGYTMMMQDITTHAINATLYPKLDYDSAKSFSTIALVASSPLMLVVNPRVPAQDVKSLIALVRAQPGKINFASSGSGSTAHLASELFAAMTGATIVHIPYKGSAPALSDLIGGQVDMMFTGTSAALPFVRAGKLRALGMSGTKRTPSLPEYPPVADALPGYDVTTIYALMGPGATPKEIVQRLNAEVTRIVGEPGPREKLLALGADPGGGSPEQLAAYIAREIPKWTKVVKAARIKGE